MVGVLPQDHDAHVVERRQGEGVEDAVGRWIEAAAGGHFGDEERAELGHVRLLELVAEHGEPAFVHPRLHVRSLCGQRCDLGHDVTTPVGVPGRVVEELGRLDADRGEPSLELLRDRRECLVEVGG